MKYYMTRVFILMLVNAFFASEGGATALEHKNHTLSNAFLYLEFYMPQQGGGLRSIKNKSGIKWIKTLELGHTDVSQRQPKSDEIQEFTEKMLLNLL